MARRPALRRVVSAEASRTVFYTICLVFLALPAAGEPPAVDPPPRSVGPVTVTATRAERGVLEVPGNVSVLDRETIERSGARNLPELLRREAGLFVTRSATSPEGYSIEARGFGNGSGVGSSLLVLVDGRRVNEADSSFTDWALMHLDHIERIEVVRGPASALYGDNAVGGTVQILTRQPDGPPRLTLRGGLGSEQARRSSLVASGAQGPVGFSLFTEYQASDGFRDRSDFRTRDLEGKVRLSLGPSAAFTLSGGYSHDDRDRPGTLSRADLDARGRTAADPRFVGDQDSARRRFVQGLLELTPDEQTRIRLLGFHRRRNDAAVVTQEFLGRFVIDTETDALGLNAQIQLDGVLLGRPSRLLLGTDLLREDLDSASLSSGQFAFLRRARRESVGVFAQHELGLHDALLLSLGLRFDDARYRLKDVQDDLFDLLPPFAASTRPDYEIWSPRAALTWLVGGGASAYVSYSRDFRFPNFDETSGVFGANPTIRPQKSDGYEVGVKVQRDRVTANLAVYHMVVHDEILLDSDVETDFFGTFLAVQNVNMARVRHRGVELSLSVRPRDWVELYGSYTLDDTRIQRDPITDLDGKRVPLTPRHRGGLGVLFRLPFWLEAGLDASYVGHRIPVNDFGHDLDTLSKFAVYDARLAFRPPLGEHLELALHFGVDNLFDREYEEVGGRPSFVPLAAFQADPRSFSRFFPAPDRSWNVGFALTVKR